MFAKFRRVIYFMAISRLMSSSMRIVTQSWVPLTMSLSMQIEPTYIIVEWLQDNRLLTRLEVVQGTGCWTMLSHVSFVVSRTLHWPNTLMFVFSFQEVVRKVACCPGRSQTHINRIYFLVSFLVSNHLYILTTELLSKVVATAQGRMHHENVLESEHNATLILRLQSCTSLAWNTFVWAENCHVWPRQDA